MKYELELSYNNQIFNRLYFNNRESAIKEYWNLYHLGKSTKPQFFVTLKEKTNV